MANRQFDLSDRDRTLIRIALRRSINIDYNADQKLSESVMLRIFDSKALLKRFQEDKEEINDTSNA